MLDQGTKPCERLLTKNECSFGDRCQYAHSATGQEFGIVFSALSKQLMCFEEVAKPVSLASMGRSAIQRTTSHRGLYDGFQECTHQYEKPHLKT